MSEIINKELLEKKHEALKKLPSFRGDVITKNNIRHLPDIKKGEMFWVSSENCAYIVTEKEGQKVTLVKLDENASISTGMTIYDMNKNIISKESIFNWYDEEAKNKLYDDMKQFMTEDAPSTYYLCYGRDLHYVTLFKVKGSYGLTDKSLDILFETIQSVGDLISVDFHNDAEKSAEIWIRTAHSPAELLYLFPYDNGLVKLTE